MHTAYLELPLDSVHHELPAVLIGVLYASSFDLVPQAVDNVLHLVIREQVGDLARSEEVVDDHQKLFLWDLSVREQEHHANALQTCLYEQLCNVSLVENRPAGTA